jgi:hypothetical protein
MSRKHEPNFAIIAGDQPTTCPFCGVRTELLEVACPGQEFDLERCLNDACGQHIEVHQE